MTVSFWDVLCSGAFAVSLRGRVIGRLENFVFPSCPLVLGGCVFAMKFMGINCGRFLTRTEYYTTKQLQLYFKQNWCKTVPLVIVWCKMTPIVSSQDSTIPRTQLASVVGGSLEPFYWLVMASEPTNQPPRKKKCPSQKYSSALPSLKLI